MHVPCIVYKLLLIPTNAQYIDNKVCIVKHCDMFRCIDIILMEHFLIIAKVTKSIKLTGYNLKKSIKPVSFNVSILLIL